MYVVCSTVDDHPTPSTKRFMQGRAGTANGSGETCGFSGGTCGASVGPLRQAAPQRHLRRLQKKKAHPPRHILLTLSTHVSRTVASK